MKWRRLEELPVVAGVIRTDVLRVHFEDGKYFLEIRDIDDIDTDDLVPLLQANIDNIKREKGLANA